MMAAALTIFAMLVGVLLVVVGVLAVVRWFELSEEKGVRRRSEIRQLRYQLSLHRDFVTSLSERASLNRDIDPFAEIVFDEIRKFQNQTKEIK